MKRFFCIIAFITIIIALPAQTDHFPTVVTSDISITIPIGPKGQRIYSAGEGVLLCDSLLFYQIHGAVKKQHEDWTIRTTGGSQSAIDSNSVTALLCKVLKAYQTMSFTSLSNCYDNAGAAELNSLLKTDSVKIKFLMAMANISHLELQVMYETDIATYLFVNVYYHDNTKSPLLFLANQTESGWKLISGEDKSDLGYNLLTYLSSHEPHNIYSSNDIDSDGIPNNTDPCPCNSGNCQ